MSHLLKKLIPLIGLALALIAGTAYGEIISKVAAVVNDTIITTYQLDQKIAAVAATDPAYANLDATARKELRSRALESMIEDELIRQRARSLKLEANDDEVNAAIDDVQQQNNLTRLQLIAALEQQGMSFETYRSNMKDQITRFKLLGKEVQSKIDVSSQEVRSYYEEHLDEYRDPPYVHLGHLLFNLPEDAPAGEKAATLAKAEKAQSRLKMGDSIADLLVTYTDAKGGDMGKLKENDLTSAFADAIVGLKTGETSDIVEVPGSIYIFKMIERSDGNPKPLEAVRTSIEEILMEKNRSEGFKAWQEKLRANAYVDIRD